ncbi:MAG: hypothetical protein DRH97_01455 [Chloroflexi bacterium]|nr:MAG: hypothetical protein DRH97_01455 [Chloroflexota bacterium]
MAATTNKYLVLLCGESSSGKTASLRNLKTPEGVVFANCESGKELPFPAKFRKMTVTDPMQVYSIFTEAEKHPEIHTIVIDSLTFLMDMYESTYVLGSSNTMAAWGEYAQFFKRLMQQHVAPSTKNVIFTAHTTDVLSEKDMVMKTMVKVKGSLMTQGIESFFNNVISCKKVALDDLKGCSGPLLNINALEEELEFKYVYQTGLTKATVNERIRGPLLMWDRPEIYIDNDVQMVIDRLHKYYT